MQRGALLPRRREVFVEARRGGVHREKRQTRLFLEALATLKAPVWQPYYARWERRKTLRLGGLVWTVRAELAPIPVRPRGRGHARIDFVRISRPVLLKGGGSIVFSILLMQRDDGTLVGSRDLRVAASVLVTPAGRSARAAIERVKPTVEAAGYTGGVQRARSTRTGRPSWLFGDFWKARLGRGGIAAERARLERLAAALREAEAR